MPRLLALLLLVLATTSCDGRGAASGAATGDFELLDAMLQIELSYRAIEPNLRDLDSLEETARSAEALVAWSEDPTFEAFVNSDRFYSEAEPFYALQQAMKAGAQRVLAGANDENLDEVRQGFIDMKQTCVRCHKRYSPSY